MNAFITRTGSFLPGEKITNPEIPEFIGEIEGEEEVRKKILRMNGIRSRHYALYCRASRFVIWEELEVECQQGFQFGF